MGEDRTKWLLQRQNIYERNEIVLEEAFTIIKEKELELTLKQNEQKKYGVVLEERRELLEKECQKSKSLILQLELIKAARGGISRGIEDDLALQKRLGESQAMQIKALESSIELKIATDSEIAKEQHKRLVFEKSLTDQIMDKIQEKQRLLDENEAVIVTLEKSKVMKQELIESQQRKVEALEIGRREKEEQAKTTALQLELKTNCQEWNALGIEMEDKFKKSSMELNKERKEVASLEKKLCEEREKSLLLEGQLKNQCDKSHSLDTSLKNERQKLCNFEKEFVDAKERWLMEKQDIHETNDKHLAEAQQIIKEGKEVTRLQKECWLIERQEISEKTDTQMVDAYKLVDEIERALKEKH